MPITRTGVLNVKGAGRDNTQWEERIWKLDGAVLTSFNAEEDGKPKGRFELRDVSNLQFESKKRECNFELPQHGKVRLRAETKSDAEAWYDSLKEAKDTQGVSTPSSPLSPLSPRLSIRSPRYRVEEELQQKMRVKFQAAVAQTKDHTVEAVINKADKSGTGTLECEEFRSMCRRICKIPPKEVSDADLDSFFEWITCEDGGVLHCEKMSEFIARRPKEEPTVAKGKMQIDQALQKLRARINVQTKGGKDVEKLYHECDGNGDGTLDFSEFKRAIRKVLKIPAGELTDKTVLTLFRILDEGDEDCVSLMDFTEFVTNPEYSCDHKERIESWGKPLETGNDRLDMLYSEHARKEARLEEQRREKERSETAKFEEAKFKRQTGVKQANRSAPVDAQDAVERLYQDHDERARRLLERQRMHDEQVAAGLEAEKKKATTDPFLLGARHLWHGC
jgi:hypothetical protein